MRLSCGLRPKFEKPLDPVAAMPALVIPVLFSDIALELCAMRAELEHVTKGTPFGARIRKELKERIKALTKALNVTPKSGVMPPPNGIVSTAPGYGPDEWRDQTK